MLSLKVEIGVTGKISAMVFNADMSVAEAIKQIEAKFGTVGENYTEYGLLKAAMVGEPARWLKEDKTLANQNLNNLELVVWKSKFTPIKVFLIDGTTKTVRIDDSSLVGDIIDRVCDMLQIERAAYIEYGLQVSSKNLKYPKWLNRDVSLQEQLSEGDKLTFKKKFFVSDANIDKSNEMQLHLIYTQAKQSIISGDYPCEKHQVVEFAAVQLQAEVGNADKKKHNAEWFEEAKYLPPTYSKLKKKLWKEIEAIWEKHVGMTTQNAKQRYVQRCRELPTYGITTFEVKEKDPEKKKLQAILFGITRRTIMRMDAETKEIIKQYPLVSVKRYSHSPNSFTIDFGSHSSGYYIVQTVRGGEIKELLDGYIDILFGIMKRGQDKDVDEGKNIANLEDVESYFAVAQVSTSTKVGIGKYSSDDFRETEFFHGRQEMEMGTTENAKRKIDSDMSTFAQQANMLGGQIGGLKPSSASMPGEFKEDLLAAASNLGRAMSDLLGGLGSDPFDLSNDKARKVLGNLKELITAARNASGETEDQNLIEAGRRIAAAIAEILQCSKELLDDPNNQVAKQNLKRAIGALRSAAGYLQGAVNGVLADPISEQLLLESAKQVYDSINRLVNSSGKSIIGVEDPKMRNIIEMQMENTKRTGATLLDCANMLAPIIIDPLAKQQLLDSAKNSKSDCDKLLRLCSNAKIPESELNRLLQVAKQVSDSLMQLAQATECASSKTAQDQEQMNNVARGILDGINQLKRTQGDGPATSLAVKNIAKLIPEFLHVIKSCAVNDPTRKTELLEGAKKLAEASRLMLMSAKPSISDPKDQNAFKKLLLAARQVGDLTRECLGDKNKLSIFTDVRSKAKEVAACLTGFANTTRGAIQDGSDPQTRRKLYESSEVATKAVQKLLDALQYASSEPDNLIAQSKLVSVAKELAKPLAQAINSTRYCLPKIDDIISKKAVKFSSDESGKALSALVFVCGLAGEVTGDKDVDQAIEEFGVINKDLDNSILDSEIGALHPNQSREESEKNLKASLLEVTRAISNLRHAHEVGLNSKKLAYAMGDVAQSSIAIASNTSGTENQKSILNATKDMIPDLLDLIKKAKGSSLGGDEDDPSLLEAAKKLQERIKDLLSTTQKGTGAEECQIAAVQVQKALSQLVLSPSYNPGDIVNLSAEVEQKSRTVAIATGKMVQIALDKNATPEQIKQAAISVASVMPTLINSVNRMTVACKNKNAQAEIIRNTQILGGHAVRVLESASTSRIDDKSAETLQQEHRYVLESVQKLLQALNEATPGIQELEKASKLLKDSQSMKDEIPEGHFGLHELSLATERLGESAVKMIQSVTVEPEKLGMHSITSARCIAEIINMVRSYSPLSEAISYAISINECVKEMEKDPSTIVENTKCIAKNVQNLNKAMQGVISSVNDQPTKLKIKEISQQIAPDLKELIQAAQNIKNTNDPKQCINSAKKLALNVNKLANLPNGSDLLNELLNTARDLANATQNMVGNATNIAKNPGDKQSIQQMTDHARELGETIKKFKQQTKKLAPGSTSCETALVDLQKAVTELDNGSMSAAVGVLEIVPEMSHQQAQEEMVKIAKKIFTSVQGVIENVKEDQWENVGLSVLSLSQHVTDSSKVAIQVAGTTTNQDTQVEHLELVKDVADESFELANLCTDLTINNSNKKLKQSLLDSANKMKDKIQKLVNSLKGGVVGLRACDEAMGLIEDSLKEFDTPVEKTDKKYAQCQVELIEQAQSCALDITQLFHTAKSEPESVGNPSKSLALSVGLMIKAAKIASSATDEKQNKEELIVSAKLLANSAKKIINSSKTVAVDKGQNPLYIEQLSRSFQEVTERVTSLISAVREGATGEKQCKEAIAIIRKNVASIESAVMVSTTGEYFVSSRIPLDSAQNELDDTIKEIVNVSKQLTSSIKGSQTDLGRAAKDLALVISKFTENSKLLGGILSDVSAQSDILTSSKLVGQRAQQLVVAAMNAQGNSKNDSIVNDKLKNLVEAIQEVRSTVKGSIGSQLEGVVLIGKTQGSISQKVKEIATTPGTQKSDPEKIIEPIRNIYKSITELYQSNGTSIGEVQSMCEELQKAYELNIQTTKASLGNVQTSKNKEMIVSSVQETGEALTKFLDMCKIQRRDDEEFERDFNDLHEILENSIKNQIESTRNIPGCEEIELEKSLADELSNEMMLAAQQILAAANELLKAPPKSQMGLDEGDLSGQILEIAREVTQRAYELLQASINAQNEIQQKGQTSNKENAYRKDPQWAKGLISAAQQVAQTTQDLVSAANSIVKGDQGSGVELIVATSRCVNSATARLVSASKVKLDLFSPNQQKLSNAASSVTKATKTLGEIAKTSVEQKMIKESSSGNIDLPKNMLALNKARLEQQGIVNNTQKSLDKAYRELKAFRREFYKEAETPLPNVSNTQKTLPTKTEGGIKKELPTKTLVKGSSIPLKGGRGTTSTTGTSLLVKGTSGGRGRATGIPVVKGGMLKTSIKTVVKSPSTPLRNDNPNSPLKSPITKTLPLKGEGGRGIPIKKTVGRSSPLKDN